MRYVDVADVLAVAPLVLDQPLEVRDWGLIDSALARPSARAFGEDAYATVHEKAAALLLSLVTNHPFVDGNKRMGLACTVVFLLKNDLELELEEDTAFDFVMSVADGTRRDVADVAAVLESWARPVAH